MEERFLGKGEDVRHARVPFETLRKSRDKVISDLKENFNKAKDHIYKRANLVALFDKELNDVINFAIKRGELFYKEADEIDRETVVDTVIAFFVVLFLSGLTG